MNWVKSSVQATTSLGVAGKATRGLEKKEKKNCAGEKLEWLLPISSTRSRPSFEVVTSRAPGAQGKGAVHATWGGWVGVATSFWCRDLAEVRTEGSLVVT